MKISKQQFNQLLSYFIRGLLLIVPFALTGYIISLALNWIDGLIPIQVPGLGMLILLVSITLLGYLGSSLLVKSFFDSIEKFLVKIPLISLIYTSLKELVAAFVGNKKKFDRPVLVQVSKQEPLYKLGFITQPSLEELQLPLYVAVYIPHSYNFSGDLYIVPKDVITPLNLSGTEVMKFIISGGVTGLHQLEEMADDNKITKDLAQHP